MIYFAYLTVYSPEVYNSVSFIMFTKFTNFRTFSGKNTGMGLLEGILPIQGSHLDLLHWQADCFPLSPWVGAGAPAYKLCKFNLHLGDHQAKEQSESETA